MAELRSNNRRFGGRPGLGFRGKSENRNRGRGSFGGGFGNRDSDRSDRSGRSGGYGRSDRPAEMHDVVCSKCGKNCQVPFKPTGSKPVLCSDCFRQSGGGSSRDSGRGPRSFGPRGPDRRFSSSQLRPASPSISPEQFNQLNAKLDKILKVLQELELDTEEPEEETEEESEEEAGEEPKTE